MASDEEIYDVEEILDKRKCGGKVEYLVKWKGYTSDDNSWVPEEDVGLAALEEYKAKELTTVTMHNDQQQTGFERGFTPKKIKNGTGVGVNLMFVMEWCETDVTDVVSNKEARIKCPKLILEYYESVLFWKGEDGNDNVKVVIPESS